MRRNRPSQCRQRGSAFITTFGILALLGAAAMAFLDYSTQAVRIANRQVLDAQTTHLCEAGVQSVLRALWRPFKVEQKFVTMDSACLGASEDTPRVAQSGAIDGIGRFAAGVVGIQSPNGDPYQRLVTVRSVGWIDRNSNGQWDAGEARKIVDVTAVFALARSQVFDYTYFVNNYGWFYGFSPTSLVVNGDVRANGNMDIRGGFPTINGSIVAALNEKLVPAAPGLVNTPAVKDSNSTYRTKAASNPRMRPGYSPTDHGAYGTAEWERWRDFLFDSAEDAVTSPGTPDSLALTGKLAGAAVMDARGIRRWSKTTSSATTETLMLDSSPTEEVIMPDLSDLTVYTAKSQNYVDNKATFQDGTANPYFGQGAWLKVWDQTLNGGAGGYKTISNNGVVSGSAILIGTSTKPILVHGPVTFTQDVAIKGKVSGQGTIYAGRNVHIIGSIAYKDPPDFRKTGGRTTQAQIDAYNEKKDILALAARGSIIMGSPKTLASSGVLWYMRPPFTKPRYDELGNLVPAYDALAVDGTGFKLYQSVMGDNALHSVAETIYQLDAILYTNFLGGGNLGGGSTKIHFNGSIISKDEAMLLHSSMEMNYDSRIRERGPNEEALIALDLPRSPVMLRSTWQDRGFVW